MKRSIARLQTTWLRLFALVIGATVAMNLPWIAGMTVLLSLVRPPRTDREPVVVDPPVRGRWKALNSPASAGPSHRTHAYGQTYAIDVAQPRPGERLGWGLGLRPPEPSPAFGAPVTAVAERTPKPRRSARSPRRDPPRADEFPGPLGSEMVNAGRHRAARCPDPKERPMSRTTEPTGEIHGYSHADASPTPWPTARDLVRDAELFWISTVRPDGRPHVTPLIAVWHDDAIWFSTGAEERKARNLAANPACILTTGTSSLADGLDVILEGTAEQITDVPTLTPVAAAYGAKYGTDVWAFRAVEGGFAHASPVNDDLVDIDSLVFRVRPDRGLGFFHGDQFSQTTWQFAT
ncbi:pyridoxamine 5'-phosphate oxidase family protein [Patulibacter sp. NPDC049589]|uniref:pyridoxamine 5'-phosphate oxidase family protein n=1 Tax=Patulibacter sp. NPDC049589 TaxID=3154731 RepID=UPI003414CB77